MAAASKADKSAKSKQPKASTHRQRKIMQPAKRGTVSRATIRKVIREVIANRPATNEN